jgi:hypothetical protein
MPGSGAPRRTAAAAAGTGRPRTARAGLVWGGQAPVTRRERQVRMPPAGAAASIDPEGPVMQDPHATPAAVAARLWELLQADGLLAHDAAIRDIAMRFGGQFVREDDGEAAIDAAVLAAFDALQRGKAAWDPEARPWVVTEDAQGL